MLIKLPIPYDLCVCIPISCLPTYRNTAWVKAHCLILNSVLNVKALVGNFNWEKALEGAFAVIVKSSRTFVSSCNNFIVLWIFPRPGPGPRCAADEIPRWWSLDRDITHEPPAPPSPAQPRNLNNSSPCMDILIWTFLATVLLLNYPSIVPHSVLTRLAGFGMQNLKSFLQL